jgi:hypothetical protein
MYFKPRMHRHIPPGPRPEDSKTVSAPQHIHAARASLPYIYNVKQQSRAGCRATLRGGPVGSRRGPGLYATSRRLSNAL